MFAVFVELKMVNMANTESLEIRWEMALEAVKKGEMVAILDSESREAETDLFFSALNLSAGNLRTLRVEAGGELYISVGNDVVKALNLPFIADVLAEKSLSDAYPILQHMGKFQEKMCQGSCNVGLSLDHRTLKTGASDDERSLTCRRVAAVYNEVVEQKTEPEKAAQLFGSEFHTPGHLFMCMENPGGLKVRHGHTELSVALARAAGIPTIMVGCVMLTKHGESHGALSPELTRAWTADHHVPFLTGPEIIQKVFGKS